MLMCFGVVSKVSSVSNFASHLSVDMADEEMPSLAMLSQGKWPISMLRVM